MSLPFITKRLTLKYAKQYNASDRSVAVKFLGFLICEMPLKALEK